jgi:hypothetical protein
MNKKNKLIVSVLTLLIGLYVFNPVKIISQTIKQVKSPKTYAEISIKEGGVWKDRKYEGGTFKNVQGLKVPAQHTDHSFYIRYEGPGWESNKIGYRLYLDWRNAIDIYGKVTDSLILSQVGQDGFESYHSWCSWGMDILKVDKGLGIGAIGRYVNKEVLHFKEVDSTFVNVQNQKNKSIVNVSYFGWKTEQDKVNLTSELTIKDDQRYTRHTIQASKSISGICTGIVRHNVDFLKKESVNKKWAYIATYGVQSLVPDKLGMAIFYKVEDVESLSDWQYDYLLVFKPSTKKITFYFLAAWEQEKDGIKTKEAFISYLNGLLMKLNKQNEI